MPAESLPVIKVVGLSAAGKSTLVRALREAGYDARSISQEHSAVRDLWKQFGVPHALIYLDVDLEAQRMRRDELHWDAAARNVEVVRLATAHDSADLVINTSSLAPGIVLTITLAWLRQRGLAHGDAALSPQPPTGAPLSSAPSPLSSHPED